MEILNLVQDDEVHPRRPGLNPEPPRHDCTPLLRFKLRAPLQPPEIPNQVWNDGGEAWNDE